MKNKRLLLLFLSIVLCSACSTTWQWQANPINSDYHSQIKSICIENNAQVKIDRFHEILINRLESHHIQIQVFNAPFKPNICEFTLNYDAVEDYETVFFISDMTLKLYNRVEQRIGLSEYHIYRGGGLDLTKYQGNDVKINRVVDGLLNSGKK